MVSSYHRILQWYFLILLFSGLFPAQKNPKHLYYLQVWWCGGKRRDTLRMRIHNTYKNIYVYKGTSCV